MRFSLLGFASAVLALPAALQSRADKPVYWLLAGDSTTAPGGGWGDGFLATTVAKGSSGTNYGHSGATTKSFRAGGDWGKVINAVGAHKSDHRVYVTIQVSRVYTALIFNMPTTFSLDTTTRKVRAVSRSRTTRPILQSSLRKQLQQVLRLSCSPH